MAFDDPSNASHRAIGARFMSFLRETFADRQCPRSKTCHQQLFSAFIRVYSGIKCGWHKRLRRPSILRFIVGAEEQALTQSLRTHVEQLAGEIGEGNIFRPQALRAAASYIERQWEQQGYVVERLAYEVSGVRSLNLEITRSGGARKREILLIGAHYDTVVGSPGANDNASGVSALLEISRLFASIEPVLTVRFVAFVNEEPPFFMTRRSQIPTRGRT